MLKLNSSIAIPILLTELLQNIKFLEDLSKMKSDAKILIIIPARSGSKGLRDKNKKIFNGNPLITFEFVKSF